jgi:glycosyltransferase involved in cell wall biosynthesis
MRLLSGPFDVTALCFYRHKPGLFHTDVGAALTALGEFGTIEAFPIPQDHSPVRLLWDHARSVARHRAYTLFAYESARFLHRLRVALSQQRFDLVHADSLDLSGYFEELGQLPIVCTHHNAESVLLGRRAAAERGLLRQRFVALQARLTEDEERLWCPRVALNLVVSAADEAILRSIAPTARFTLVPNGVDVAAFAPSDDVAPTGLVAVAGLSSFANRDGLDFFCESILPHLRTAGAAVPVRWLGRATESQRQAYEERFGVKLTGYVEDVRPAIRAAACYVAPIRVGGGTRVKILDAWAMGKAVVSTSIGCEGLQARDGANILIRDDPAAFAEAVRAVLADTALRKRLGSAARATVERHYSWERIGRDLIPRYIDLAGAGRATRKSRRQRLPT